MAACARSAHAGQCHASRLLDKLLRGGKHLKVLPSKTRVLMPKDDDDKKSALHAYAAETLDNEVERFWKRSLFFWGFIAAAFVAYGVLIEKSDKDLPLAISCFGLICSIAWTLANRGSKYWQYHWEEKLKSVEVAALGRAIFSEDVENKDRDL